MADIERNYSIETLGSFLRSAARDTSRRIVIRLLRPPRGGSPFGRLLVVNVCDRETETVVTVSFEEYLS